MSIYFWHVLMDCAPFIFFMPCVALWLTLLQIYQEQKDRKLLAPCTIFNKSRSLLWATWFICLNFLSSQFTEMICFCWIWYKEPGVFCLSVSDRSVDYASSWKRLVWETIGVWPSQEKEICVCSFTNGHSYLWMDGNFFIPCLIWYYIYPDFI